MLQIIMKSSWAGLFSAASMPLGAITSRFWHPSGRVIGALTAFGAGALLSATVLDLVAAAVDEGHLIELIVGSIIGSLFFTSVNHLVNRYGGFLRKPATAAAHLRQQQAKQFANFLGTVRRMDIFCELPLENLQQLAQATLITRFDKNEVIYPASSPCESLYVLQSGEVQLLDPNREDPNREMQPFITLQSGDSFSRMAFFTGTPHGTITQTTTACEVAILPRSVFEDLLETSPELNTATQWMIQGEEVAHYLQERHHFTQTEVQDWVDRAVFEIRANARIPDAVALENKADQFIQIARQLKRLPLLGAIPVVMMGTGQAFCPSYGY